MCRRARHRCEGCRGRRHDRGIAPHRGPGDLILVKGDNSKNAPVPAKFPAPRDRRPATRLVDRRSKCLPGPAPRRKRAAAPIRLLGRRTPHPPWRTACPECASVVDFGRSHTACRANAWRTGCQRLLPCALGKKAIAIPQGVGAPYIDRPEVHRRFAMFDPFRHDTATRP